MKLSKREYIALELLKEMVKVDDNDVANRAYLLADEFIAISDESIDESDNNRPYQESALDPIFSLDVSVLETSSHANAVLNYFGIKTIGDLVIVKLSDLKNSPRTDINSRTELRDNLKQKGLSLDMNKHEMYDYSSDKYVRITEDAEGNPMLRPVLQ